MAIFYLSILRKNGEGNIKKAGKINVLNDNSALFWAYLRSDFVCTFMSSLRMLLFKATCTFIFPVFNLIFYCFIFALISFIENLVYF